MFRPPDHTYVPTSQYLIDSCFQIRLPLHRPPIDCRHLHRAETRTFTLILMKVRRRAKHMCRLAASLPTVAPQTSIQNLVPIRASL